MHTKSAYIWLPRVGKNFGTNFYISIIKNNYNWFENPFIKIGIHVLLKLWRIITFFTNDLLLNIKHEVTYKFWIIIREEFHLLLKYHFNY